MWPQTYFNATYWTATYWPKTGATGASPPPPVTGGASQLLPLMGVGSWLLFMVLT